MKAKEKYKSSTPDYFDFPLYSSFFALRYKLNLTFLIYEQKIAGSIFILANQVIAGGIWKKNYNKFQEIWSCCIPFNDDHSFKTKTAEPAKKNSGGDEIALKKNVLKTKTFFSYKTTTANITLFIITDGLARSIPCIHLDKSLRLNI